jgi:hypothetical protein
MDYGKQATDFLVKHGLTFRATQKADRCPPYCGEVGQCLNERAGTCMHGDRYRITISRKGGGRISFDFWNSLHDVQNGATTVDPYSALSCIGGDAHCAGTFEDFCADSGYDEDSRKAHDTWKRCHFFAQRLQRFFGADELEALAEIQ